MIDVIAREVKMVWLVVSLEKETDDDVSYRLMGIFDSEQQATEEQKIWNGYYQSAGRNNTFYVLGVETNCFDEIEYIPGVHFKARKIKKEGENETL